MLLFSQENSKKGVVLLLSVLILAILLAIALGVSTILVSQFRMLQNMEYSVQAFFAADTGIERALFEEQSLSGALPNGASYQVQFFVPGTGDCEGENYCLKSVGVFRGTRRALEITR